MKSGKIFFVEGLWHTGKTTLCQILEKNYGFLYIKEPNHILAEFNSTDEKSITNWYLAEHFKNIKKGLKKLQNRKNIVIERSPISSLAFIKARFPRWKTNKIFKNFQKLIKNCSHLNFCLIYLFPENIKNISDAVKKDNYIKTFSNLKLLTAVNNNLLHYVNIIKNKKIIRVIKIKSDANLVKNFKKNIFGLNI